MKTLTITLVMVAVLEMTTPPLARSLSPGGGGGGFGGMDRGGVGQLNSAGPLNHVDPIDREGLFDQGAMRDPDRGTRGPRRPDRFPTCVAYAYCPPPVWPCERHEGYWTAQPGVHKSAATRAWIPTGCY